MGAKTTKSGGHIGWSDEHIGLSDEVENNNKIPKEASWCGDFLEMIHKERVKQRKARKAKIVVYIIIAVIIAISGGYLADEGQVRLGVLMSGVGSGIFGLLVSEYYHT